MLNHVTIGTNDLARAKAFYDRIMATIGIGCFVVNEARGHVGYAEGPTTTPQVYLLQPIDGQIATVGIGQTFAFLAGDRAGVRAFHAAALAAGGTCEGPPGPRPTFHPDIYIAFVRDLDGHKLACVCRKPED